MPREVLLGTIGCLGVAGTIQNRHCSRLKKWGLLNILVIATGLAAAASCGRQGDSGVHGSDNASTFWRNLECGGNNKGETVIRKGVTDNGQWCWGDGEEA